MSEKRKRISRRIWSRSALILAAFFAIAAAIICKLAYLQIYQYDFYKEKVISEITMETEVNPERGTIYDANGNMLATNKTVYLCIISPQDIIDAMADDNADETQAATVWTSSDGTVYTDIPMDQLISRFFADTLGVDYSKVLEKTALKGRRYEVIQKKVSEEDAEKIRKFISDYKLTAQIYLRAGAIRYYPYNELASHALGFTDTDGIGIYGLEAYYNNLLEGTNGRYVTAQDAHNKDMGFEYETFIEAEDGYNVVTSLDTYIQYELENQLETTVKENLAANRATGIAMNVKTGEILAMATSPGFNLNAPYELDELSAAKLAEYEGSEDRVKDARALAAKKIATEYPNLSVESEEYAVKLEASFKADYDELYKQALTNKRFEMIYAMWKNKAITELYEPGSTSKIFTAAMVLEEGSTKLTDNFTCTGALKVEGYPKPISCHKTTGHGTVTFARGLQQSCNPTMMMAALKLGREKFYSYFEGFGYTDRTGIDLPNETKGLYSSYDDFSNVSLAVYSFGQTYKTTPIQQLTAVASVANGGYLVTPHLLHEVKDDEGNVIETYETKTKRQVISTEICRSVTAVLEEGVSTDGGAKNAYVKGYKVAAKTGTSEKIDTKDETGQTTLRVSSCVAFAPADDPEIAVIIMVDEPMGGVVYGSIVAAPYVANFLSNVLPYLGYEPQYTEKELTTVEAGVLSYYGYSVADACSDINTRGLKYEVVGSGDTVTSQVPAQGTTVSKESGRIILYTGDEQAKATNEVPDVIGKTGEAANRILVNAGFNVSIKGATGDTGATVVTQSHEAGSMAARGTVIEISLRHLDVSDD